jgi:hypothetical protein
MFLCFIDKEINADDGQDDHSILENGRAHAGGIATRPPRHFLRATAAQAVDGCA